MKVLKTKSNLLKKKVNQKLELLKETLDPVLKCETQLKIYILLITNNKSFKFITKTPFVYDLNIYINKIFLKK